MTTTAPHPPAPENKSRQRLLSYSSKNMIYSVLAVVGVAMILWAMFPGEQSVQRRGANAEAVAMSFAEDVTYDVYIPTEALGDDWTVTTATVTEIGGEETWRLGIQTPSGGHIALSQTEHATEQWRDAILRQTAPLSEQTIDSPAGQLSWEEYIGDNSTGLAQLVGSESEPGTIVFTQSAHDEIFDFVAHLEIAEPVTP